VTAKELDGRIALVTGAGSGIGEAIARRFSSAGATVVCNDVTLDRAKRTVDSLTGTGHAVAADVSQRAEIDAMYDEIDDRFGGLDVLVNNAGVAESAPGELDRVGEAAERIMSEAMSGQPRTTHWDVLPTITDDSWHRMLAIHLSGTFFNLRAAVPRMAARGGGSIVNISSEAARLATPTPHYSAAKAGILGLTRAVAFEAASHNIRVNAICPGVIDTPASRAGSPALTMFLAGTAPLGRIGTADELAAAALFLASDASSFMTGQTLGVNGGVHM
jgi:3-oxoacyl-[acyl-carrier protein] reductase